MFSTSYRTGSILAIALMALASAAQAQFEEGDNVLGAGIGIGGAYSNIGFSSNVSQTPAISLHFDHGMGELGPGQWGLGGYLGYKHISYSERYYTYWTYDYSWTYFILGVRGSWHYNDWHTDKLDTYGGFMLAYDAVTFKDNTNYGSYSYLNTYSYGGSYISFTGFLGARYFFNDKIGAYAEQGYGVAALQLGVSVRL
jgi:hypothetical protein